MTERSFQDAVQVLKEQLGGRWEGVETEGRDEMVRILKDRLGYDNRAANDAIDAMIESGTLRYHPHAHVEGDANDSDDEPPVIGAPAGLGTAAGAPVASGQGGMPLVPAMIDTGHWEIGPGESDELGRKGQVTPR